VFPGIEHEVDAYWRSTVEPYWREIARTTEPLDGLRLCSSSSPERSCTTATFQRLGSATPSLAVNLDPSHLFWQSMDPLEVVRRLSGRSGSRTAKTRSSSRGV